MCVPHRPPRLTKGCWKRGLQDRLRESSAGGKKPSVRTRSCCSRTTSVHEPQESSQPHKQTARKQSRPSSTQRARRGKGSATRMMGTSRRMAPSFVSRSMCPSGKDSRSSRNTSEPSFPRRKGEEPSTKASCWARVGSWKRTHRQTIRFKRSSRKHSTEQKGFGSAFSLYHLLFVTVLNCRTCVATFSKWSTRSDGTPWCQENQVVSNQRAILAMIEICPHENTIHSTCALLEH